MGTTVKQVNNIKIKQGVDGMLRLYQAKKEKGTCLLETASMTEAINFCKNYNENEKQH